MLVSTISFLSSAGVDGSDLSLLGSTSSLDSNASSFSFTWLSSFFMFFSSFFCSSFFCSSLRTNTSFFGLKFSGTRSSFSPKILFMLPVTVLHRVLISGCESLKVVRTFLISKPTRYSRIKGGVIMSNFSSKDSRHDFIKSASLDSTNVFKSSMMGRNSRSHSVKAACSCRSRSRIEGFFSFLGAGEDSGESASFSALFRSLRSFSCCRFFALRSSSYSANSSSVMSTFLFLFGFF
mmetsp:Transcript_665/g.1215  ORF Transcript_665/g.1215 Transcript_665/m.1215 type:complete len:236 (-) Transcript_665:432-1139(-)